MDALRSGCINEEIPNTNLASTKMCINPDTIYKIVELIISASVPILIFIFGIKVTRKIEDAKNESNRIYYWQTKWRESFYEKQKGYISRIAILLADFELLKLFIQKGTQNDPEGTLLQNEINDLAVNIFKDKVELKVLASTLFGEHDEITKAIENVYLLIAKLLNNKAGDLSEILKELEKLNSITGKFFDKSIKS